MVGEGGKVKGGKHLSTVCLPYNSVILLPQFTRREGGTGNVGVKGEREREKEGDWWSVGMLADNHIH